MEIMQKKLIMETKLTEMRIHITEKNWTDIFSLPCVRAITKTGDGSIKIKVKLAACTYEYATIGDWIVIENGECHIEKE